MTSRQYAPRTREQVSRTASTSVLVRRARAKRCMNTSVSLVVLKMEPSLSSSSRSSAVLTRFPLWATAMSCPRKWATKGWALRICERPVVE